MRLFIFFTVGMMTLSGLAQKKKLDLRLTWQEPYCGGARPTEAMEAEAARDKPYAGKTVILLSAKGRVDSVRTDSGGVVHLNLRRGTYRLMEPWRYYRTGPNGSPNGNFDAACLEKEWGREFKRLGIRCSRHTVESVLPLLKYCDWQLPCLKDQAGGNVPD